MTALWERRRFVLSLVLCLVVALGIAVTLRTFGPGSALGSTLSASPTASPTPALHQTYTFSLISMSSDAVLRVGQPITLRWIPSLGRPVPTSLGPALIHCTLALYGPYPSLADLTKALNALDSGSDGIAPPGPPAFTAPPLTLSDWNPKPHNVGLVLPMTLHAGYYEADAECTSDRDQSGGGVGFPLQIGA